MVNKYSVAFQFKILHRRSNSTTIDKPRVSIILKWPPLHSKKSFDERTTEGTRKKSEANLHSEEGTGCGVGG